MKAAIIPLLIVLAIVAAPLATAATAELRLEASGDIWNGESSMTSPPEGGFVNLWLPPGARIQSVEAVFETHNATTPWRAGSGSSLQASAPANASHVLVRFDMRGTLPVLAHYVAPSALARVDFIILPPAGTVVQSPGAHFAENAGTYRASVAPVHEGQSIAIQVVDQGRVGELSVLASIVLLAILALVGGIIYHKVRPPNEGRAPEKFLDHLAELQARLLPPILAFGLLNVVFFTMGLRLVQERGFDFLAPTFGIESSLSARAFDAFAERLVPAGVQLIVTRPIDAALAQVQTSLFLAFASTLPLLLYELGVFISPALLPKERRLALRTLPIVSSLFLVGALFGLIVMAPLMIRTLYEYAPALGATPYFVVQDLVGFALLVLLVFGTAFELPVLMYVLSRFGLVQAKTYAKYWRHAIVAIFLVGGIITPDPSMVSQAIVSIPLTGLYLVGIVVARWGENSRLRAAHDETADAAE